MLPQDPPSVAPRPQRWQFRYPWRWSILALHVPQHLRSETLWKFSYIFASIEQIKIAVGINMSLLNREVQVRQHTLCDSLQFRMTDPADLSAWIWLNQHWFFAYSLKQNFTISSQRWNIWFLYFAPLTGNLRP